LTKIAVFGTLKEERCNNWRMEAGGAKYLGPAVTKDKMALHGLQLFDTREVAPVVVDLYEMSEEGIKEFVDPIEVHAYDRKVKSVVDKDGNTHEAFMYISFPKWDRGYNDNLKTEVFDYTGM